jgi:RNA polymerase sigma factor (sigma-70 family)
MPGMSGLQMQAELADRAPHLPVIIITGHGDIDAARQAFKASAIDFFEKPFDDESLLTAIDRALRGAADAEDIDQRMLRAPALSQREREVMELVVAGLGNKEIGERLGISPRTVEVHKSRLMTKLDARNLADLIRLVGAS